VYYFYLSPSPLFFLILIQGQFDYTKGITNMTISSFKKKQKNGIEQKLKAARARPSSFSDGQRQKSPIDGISSISTGHEPKS
jgi:hypothetical protein